MEYNDQVRELLQTYHDKIEIEVMPNLSKEFTNFYSGVTELLGKLKNKGLIKDDPYFEASEILDIKVLDNSNFSIADTQWKVSERITNFEAILSYITHNYNFSLNTFNFDELEKMKKFLDYYNWKELLNPTVSDQNTQAFGHVALSFRGSTTDSLVLKTFDNCVENINKSITSILNSLKFLLLYLKESYKQFIRMDIMPIVLGNNPNPAESQIGLLISTEIQTNYSYLKLYKKYITEVVKEEFYDEGKDLKDKVIKRLTITNPKVEKEIIQEFDKEKDLLLLLLELGKVRIHISGGIEKLQENHLLLAGKNGSFISLILKKISAMLFNITPKTIYSVNVKSKPVSIHFENFYSEIKKLEFDLLSFTEEDKVKNYIKLNTNNINHNIDKLLMIIKKKTVLLLALDEYLKSELKTKKIKAKGIKPEITVIKSIINSVTGMYRDYIEKVDKK